MNNVCFLDTETEGLTPEVHHIWEVALIVPDGFEYVWQFPVTEMRADSKALEIGHYWERCWSVYRPIHHTDALFKAHMPEYRGRTIRPDKDWARTFQSLTAGMHLCGAVVSFDEERLRRLLRSVGVLPRWHYHLITVEALAAGWLLGQAAQREEWSAVTDEALPPWDSEALSRAVGVEPGQFERHSALGDARWAKAIYRAVMGRAS